MNEEDMTHILVYGSRRLDACKKLGWNTIPSVVNRDGKITLEDIPINSIKILDNVRIIRNHAKDVSELMSSIKQDGLLEPIGTRPYDSNLSDESLVDISLKIRLKIFNEKILLQQNKVVFFIN